MSIQFKRSTVSGVQPSSTNMYQGELAINLPDKKLFTMDNNNEIINIGFSKDEADSTYLPFTGGTITGPLEISNSTPFIDFHYNYSTADYTHRIIASDANTLKLIANTTEVSGALKVDGSVSTTNIVASGSITASGTLTINNTVRANTFRAAGGVPANDGATCGYSFDNNGDSGLFYENASTTSYGGYLNLRNDGTLCLSLNSTQAVVYPLLNAQGGLYTGTDAAQNTMSTNNGIIELYAETPAIDFHFGNSSTDYTSRIIANESGLLTITSNLKVLNQIIANGHIWGSGSAMISYDVVAGRDISATGKLTLSGDNRVGERNGVFITGASGGSLTFYDKKDPDSGIYNYTLLQDNGNFSFCYSNRNVEFDLGTAKHTFDCNGNYTAAGGIHSTGNLTVGSATMQGDGNIYMPWAGNWLSNLLNNASVKGVRIVEEVQVYNGTPGRETIYTTTPTWIFGGITPTYVLYKIRVWGSGYTDIRHYFISAGSNDDQYSFVFGVSSDDTDQGGTATIAGSNTFTLPYKYNQPFRVGFNIITNGNAAPRVYITAIGYQQ